MKLKNRQISLGMILFSSLTLVFSALVKVHRWQHETWFNSSENYPLDEYTVDYFLFDANFANSLLLLLLILGIGIFLLLTRDDKEIKETSKVVKNKIFRSIKGWRKRKILLSFMALTCIVILYSLKVRGYDVSDVEFWIENDYEVPLSLYEVDFIIFEFGYQSTMNFLLFMLFVLFLLFIFIDDKLIYDRTKKLSMMRSLKKKPENNIAVKQREFEERKNEKNQEPKEPILTGNELNEGRSSSKSSGGEKSLMKSYSPFGAVREARVFLKQWIKSFYKFLIVFIVGLILIFSLIGYWLKLDNSADPLNLWEAFFLSYGKILFIVALATIALGVVNKLFFTDRKEMIKKEEGNKVKVKEKIHKKTSDSHVNVTTPVKPNSKKSKFEKTEIVSLVAIVVFSLLSWVYFNDVLLLQKTFDSVLSINIYNKILDGNWDLGVGESALFKANLSAATWEEFYGSDAPNLFVGLTVFFAFLFFARHVQKRKEDRKKLLLVLTAAIVVMTSLNFAFVEYTDNKRTEAIQYFHDQAEDVD